MAQSQHVFTGDEVLSSLGEKLETPPVLLVVLTLIPLGLILTGSSCLEPPASRPHSLEGQGEVVLAGLTVAHQIAGLFAQPEQVLGICSADGPVIPAEDKRKKGGHLCWVPGCPGPPILSVPSRQVSAGKGGEGPQLDTDTHTWFSRGSAGSVHSPRGLLGSMLRGLADLGFPAESRGGRRPFSSRPGDRQLFSDPSNWAVGNIPVTDSEDPRGRAL